MEKVILTKEQAEAIEEWVNKGQLIVAKAAGLLEHGKDEPIEKLTMEEIVKAIYIGYEVEPEFKVGDWIHVSWSNTEPAIHKVIKIGVRNIDGDEGGIEIDWDDNSRPPLDIVRPATPSEIAEEKEQRFFARHGRKPWDLRKGDLLLEPNGTISEVEGRIGAHSVQLNRGMESLNLITPGCKVICFAESRLDVKTNE